MKFRVTIEIELKQPPQGAAAGMTAAQIAKAAGDEIAALLSAEGDEFFRARMVDFQPHGDDGIAHARD